MNLSYTVYNDDKSMPKEGISTHRSIVEVLRRQVYRGTLYDASRGGKKTLDSSYDQMKARTVVGTGEEGPLCDPSKLLPGGSAITVREQYMGGNTKEVYIVIVAGTIYCFMLPWIPKSMYNSGLGSWRRALTWTSPRTMTWILAWTLPRTFL